MGQEGWGSSETGRGGALVRKGGALVGQEGWGSDGTGRVGL